MDLYIELNESALLGWPLQKGVKWEIANQLVFIYFYVQSKNDRLFRDLTEDIEY